MHTDKHLRITCPDCHRTFTVRGTSIRCCGKKRLADGESVEVAVAASNRVTRLWKAHQRWIKSGKPVRSEDEIEAIVTTQCVPCEFFNRGICTHKKCGCTLALSRGGHVISRIAVAVAKAIGVKPPLVEKIRMATEHCPIGKW